MDINRIHEDRLRFLNSIYDETDGDEQTIVNSFEIGKNLGFDGQQTNKISVFLNNEGYIRDLAMGGGVGITHDGVKYVEEIRATDAEKLEPRVEPQVTQAKIKRLFISYIHEESVLAMKLKECIESIYSGQCEVFVSCDKKDIPAGKKWLQTIGGALREADGLIVLCSPESIARSWVNFEMGCCYIKDINIFPICHSGLSEGQLPLPISEFQALELIDPNFVEDLLYGIDKNLDITHGLHVNIDEMRSELLKASENKSIASSTTGEPVQNNQRLEVSSDELQILSKLAASADNLSASDLGRILNVLTQKAQYFLDNLVKTRMVGELLNYVSGTTYYLTKQGRKYLVDEGLL